MKGKALLFWMFGLLISIPGFIFDFNLQNFLSRNLVSFHSLNILVSISTHWSPGRSLEYLFRLLEEYESVYPSAGYNIHVCIDVNSAEVANILSSHPHTQSTRVVRVWSLEDLGGDPYNLPQFHRKYWEEHETEFDFFIFSEEDILFSLEAFNTYVERRQALQEKGWVFGWVRVETWGGDNKTLVVIDDRISRMNPTIFETPDGNLWAQSSISYTAHYILDREELRRSIEDESRIWNVGFSGFDFKGSNILHTGPEFLTVGFQYKYSGNEKSVINGAKGWQSRALVPISRTCEVEIGGIVYHLPSKYGKNSILAKDNECLEVSSSHAVCGLGKIPLFRVFICDEVKPISLPMWPEKAKIG